jgi:hypothetical protein
MKKTFIGLAIALGLAAITTSAITTSAHAASPACGASCMTLTSEAYGPGYVTSVPTRRILFQAPRVGMAAAGPDENEDFQSLDLGTVSVLYHYGIVSADVNLMWGNDTAYEYVYAPGGKAGSLCLGTGSTAVQGAPVILEQCGVSARTVWIVLPNSTSRIFTPLINGSDTRLFDPFVLTAGSDNGQLTVDELVLSLGKVPAEAQMWRDLYGPIP